MPFVGARLYSNHQFDQRRYAVWHGSPHMLIRQLDLFLLLQKCKEIGVQYVHGSIRLICFYNA